MACAVELATRFNQYFLITGQNDKVYVLFMSVKPKMILLECNNVDTAADLADAGKI